VRLPTDQLKYHPLSIATGAFTDITAKGTVFQGKPRLTRLFVGSAVFIIIVSRRAKIYVRAAIRLIKA
jgi:hypothetical protein